MFTDAQVEALVDNNKLEKDLAVTLLNIYVTRCDEWWDHVVRLYKILYGKHGEDEARVQLKDIVSFTILFPAYKRTVNIDHQQPDENLFRWMWYDQRQKRDWFEDLKKVVKQDHQIAKWRTQVLSHGVIDPIEYQPLTRQAFNWTIDRAEKEELYDQETRKKFRKFVMVYGGANVCRCFESFSKEVNQLVNWRSPYFLERLVYKINDRDVSKVIGIKLKELEKTNSKFVKRVT